MASYVYNIPGASLSSAFLRHAFGGWSLSGVTTMQTGKPFSITDAQGATIYAATSYASFAPGKGVADAVLTGSTQSRLNNYFNTSVFVKPDAIGNGTGFGNVGRNILRGPGQVNFDMALKKQFALTVLKESRLEFRSEFFNIFNHTQFANPGNARATPASFGVISSTVTAPRIIQFGLKFTF